MLISKTVDIADDERALLFRRNRLEKVLTPGRHRLNRWGGPWRLQHYDISLVEFEEPNAKLLCQTHRDKLAEQLDIVHLSDQQMGLLRIDGHLTDILAPGSFHAYWKSAQAIDVEIVEISQQCQVDNKLLGILRQTRPNKIGNLLEAFYYAVVADENIGLLFIDGKFEKKLPVGHYGYWKYNRNIQVRLLDLRLQTVEVNGQEILTSDRVSLRINLSANYRIVEPELTALKLADPPAHVYREAQLRLREAVGTQTLDALLADKNRLNAEIADGIRKSLRQYGIELQSIGVKDIILPGDMKAILNQVVEAQKAAEANLIKRREETQAMRSLHNTAKVMENNPTLLRLKELEALERITGQIDHISVYGGLDAVLSDLVKLAPKT